MESERYVGLLCLRLLDFFCFFARYVPFNFLWCISKLAVCRFFNGCKSIYHSEGVLSGNLECWICGFLYI